jgi:hypothetical protein
MRRPPHSMALYLAGAAMATLLMRGAPPRVQADDQTPAGEHDPGSVGGEVWVVLATGYEGTIDPALSHLRGLKHPPFNAYKSMKVLSRKTVQLQLDQPVEMELPKNRTLVLRLVERLPDGRAKVQVSINRPNQRDSLPSLQVIASAGEPFFVAGQKFEGGTLVIGVRVGESITRAP